jgi:geranylgeranyl pyrophosphate synthase
MTRGASGNSGTEQLAPVLEAGGEEVAALLERTEERLREIARGHGAELGGHAADTLAAGGKRLRPTLVFLCAGSGGRAAPTRTGGSDRRPERANADGPDRRPELVRAAAAVELLHMATLVHDDVLDRATLRRGRPTVFAAGGRAAAAATGDLLLSRAFGELALTRSPEAVSILSLASSALARGELMQRADAWSDAVTPERYLERCELKTARLFEAACRLGAIFGAPGAEAAAELGAFGSRIGIAFQIFDDVLDVSGPTERTGKQRGADLLDGTVTLPLILARRKDRELRDLDLRAAVTDASQAGALCDRIALTGALGQARERALHYVAEAKAALSDLDLPARQSVALHLVADGVVERYA